MKITNKRTIIPALLALAGPIKADCTFSGGNWYCSQTDAIIYTNVGISSSYMEVTNMDESTCQCQQVSFPFSGSLAPLNEELSVHFRGPIQLKQFGVYYPMSGFQGLKKRHLQKRDINEDDFLKEECQETVRTRVRHAHKRDVAVEYVEVTATVYVDEEGQIVTDAEDMLGNDFGQASEAPEGGNSYSSSPQTSNDWTSSSSSTSEEQWTSSSSSSSSISSTSSSEAATSSSAGSGSGSGSYSPGNWQRAAYYTPGNAENCTFMNHMGGTAGSGVWSSCFGNSISFMASNGVDGAAQAQALGDVTVNSGNEFMIFSGVPCNGYDVCGYYREGIPAYQGFAGDFKIFVFEFSMPSQPDATGLNQDMPAIWMLNAKIPRTVQYGKADCSCWSTGCGELDLFEILDVGSNKLITHIHDSQGGGTQDWFERPVDSTMKAAVIFDGSDRTIHIVEVNDEFGSILSEETVSAWLSKTGTIATLP